ncbi:hypothetical protein [Xenococcus sp. PCC 7305]|nr:hypothetical protein [Xenococcus sp. PCC 7305]
MPKNVVASFDIANLAYLLSQGAIAFIREYRIPLLLPLLGFLAVSEHIFR